MHETKATRVASVKPLGDYSLRLRWVHGTVTDVDLREPVYRFKVLQPLRNKAFFAQAKKGEGGHSVVWSDEIDLGAGRLWERALEQNGREDVLEFVRWRLRNCLSLTAAAEALGISRRQVAYYLSGRYKVPRVVLLACKGWEAQRSSKKSRKRP